MTENPSDSDDRPGQNHVLHQLGRLRRAGLITNAQARAIEAADDDDALNAAILAIRTRHAGARLDAAVQDGSLARAEADDLLWRIRAGEHGRGLRSHISRLRRGSRAELPTGRTDDAR